jgi:hypothetical protein
MLSHARLWFGFGASTGSCLRAGGWPSALGFSTACRRRHTQLGCKGAEARVFIERHPRMSEKNLAFQDQALKIEEAKLFNFAATLQLCY